MDGWAGTQTDGQTDGQIVKIQQYLFEMHMQPQLLLSLQQPTYHHCKKKHGWYSIIVVGKSNITNGIWVAHTV